MLRYRLVKSLFLLYSLVSTSEQVDIAHRYTNEHVYGAIRARCPNIPPGVCCEAPFIPNPGLEWISGVTFEGLTAMDIAAIWGPRPRFPLSMVTKCSGRVLDSQMGPGTWDWLAARLGRQVPGIIARKAEGASYVTLPESLPPPPVEVPALFIQGILGLVWGGGKWFASPAAERLLGGKGHPSPKRDIRSRDKGTMYARPPKVMVVPTFININGTEYIDGGSGNHMYMDHSTGNTLNLTDWFT